jgi:predicted CXXCH cytochrome family protein
MGLGCGRAVLQLLLIGIVGGVLGAGALSRGQDDSEAAEPIRPGEDGWVSLFEGATKRGWTGSGPSDWKLVEGRLTGRNGVVLNRWCWVDFEVQVKFKGNGSILFRVGSDQMGHIGYRQPGYRFDLASGELVSGEGTPLARADSRWAGDQWHLLELKASEGTVSVVVDGQSALATSDTSSPLKGRIGLGAAGAALEVQYVRVRPLNTEELQNIPAENDYCYVCHANFEYDEPLVAVHDEAEVGCVDCHGPSLAHRSDEDNVTPPDILYRRPQIDVACLGCHTRHEEREAPPGTTAPEVAVCTDCHGEHRLW